MTDTALRAMTEDGAFRVIAVRTTETVREAGNAQDARGEVRRLFGELLTGSILIRHTMAPDLRVQAILQGDDRASRMVADANPDGTARGLVQLSATSREKNEMEIGKQGVLQVARTLYDGSIHQGVVAVPEDGSISGALMRYMQDSEQIVSIIATGCDMDPSGEVRAAGGFVLQLLPELDNEGQLAVMTERMRDFEKMGPLFASGAAEPEALVREILYGMPYALVGTDPLSFGCNCSQARVAASLASLPKREIQAMIDDKRVLEIGCDYCGKEYRMAPEQLRGLLEAH
jgi:molecular chaperone Hsp33